MGGREGVLDIFSVSIVVAFFSLHSPMEPDTGWDVHGGLCVDTIRSEGKKEKN